MLLRARSVRLLLATLGATVLLAGCTYYRIKDPVSNKTYYTNAMTLQQSGYSGAVRFVDAKTGQTVTIQNSEMSQISEKEFKSATSQ